MRFTRNIILTLLIIVLCSAMAFASEDSPSPEQAPLEVDWPQLELMTSAGAVRAAAKTLDDVYNILNTGLMSGSTPKLDNIYSNIASNLEFWAGSTRYSIADLQGMTWQLANSINNQLSSTNSILGNIYNNIGTTNAKLEYVFSAIEDTINIKWYDYPASYVGTKTSSNGSYLSSLTNSSLFIVDYSFSDYIQPSLIRLSFPVLRYAAGHSDSSQYFISSISASSGNNSYSVTIPEYFILPTSRGLHVYLFGFSPVSGYKYSFSLSSAPYNSTFYSNGMTGAFYIPFDTLDYQIIKTAFNQAKSADSDKKSLDQLVSISSQLSVLAQSSQSGSQAAEALADYIVSPQKQAAEDSSQQVINSTLNNFTGSGSGAAKSSDSNAMKDVSGSLQSGLNAGGSVSGATGVFNSSGDFWKWFSQENSNYINNPYPAPVVSPTRGAGDEIVDFLTPNSNELQDLLRQGGDQR